jgi:hypothetical protein
MPEPTGVASFQDLSGSTPSDLSLLNAMTPVSRELRAIRVMLGFIYNEMSGKDVDITEFTGLEALEG